MTLNYRIRDGETVEYMDVISLYPFIWKHFKITVGHPTIHAGDVCKEMDVMVKKDGLSKCTILPLRRLCHPVLPYRCNNRLLFCLCRTCAIELNTAAECTHETVAQRALVGTWVMDEVRLAVQHGNRLIEVHEVYN
jgi:hypothetical protein